MGNASTAGSDSKDGGSAGDRFVTGGTNWDSYDLPQLIAMVNDKVDIPALVRLADDWRAAGDAMVGSAGDLAAALNHLMDFWSGAASEQARADVALNAQWVADLGDTARDIGDPIDEAAGALRAAQEQMPKLPAIAPVLVPGSATDGAQTARIAGGPLGAAIGAAAAGSESAAQSEKEQTELKRQAVETMRRFETAAMGIDESIPEFTGPRPELSQKPKPKPEKPPVDTTATAPPDTSWRGITGGSDTSAQGNHGATSVGRAASVGTGALSAPPPPANVPTGGPVGPGAGIGPVPKLERMPAAMAGGMIDPDGPGGMGAGGTPMGGGMGAGANSENDHRRRFPFEAEDPFALDQKASPPVIGL